jgi:hypothetical protein
MEKTIKVIVKKPGVLHSEVREIPNELEYFQNLVGGYIETVALPKYPDVIIVCNEEGKLMGLRPNIMHVEDYIRGPVVLCTTDGEEFASIPDEQIKDIQNWLKVLHVFGKN